MQYIYTFLISFIFIFISELGDKTQILVLSFSTKNKTLNILIGVALGSLFSHGLAITFGSHLGILGDERFLTYLKIFTYITFLLLGITGFLKSKKNICTDEDNNLKSKIINLFCSIIKNCILIVALSIAIGELGDKTFLASIGLGLQYPNFKITLILGAICGMIVSDSIAIFFGKLISSKSSNSTIEFLSNLIFLVFGIIGLFGTLAKNQFIF